jgi:hypothetical protein
MEIIYHLTQSPLSSLGLFLESAPSKPKIRCSILLDPDPLKSLAGTQKTGPHQSPESVRAFLSLWKTNRNHCVPNQADKVNGCDLRRMPYSSSQSVEVRVV